MSDTNTIRTGGTNILGLLGVLFVGLKLGGVIDWSWWYVTMPFWIGLAIAAVILVFAGILWVIATALGNRNYYDTFIRHDHLRRH